MKVGVIFNPAAGKSTSINFREMIQTRMLHHQSKFLLIETKFPGHVKEIVSLMLSSKIERIAIVGGDGSLNEVGEELINTNIPIGLIPAGTGNDYHKNFNIPHCPKEALDLFLSNNVNIKNCDGGKVWDKWFFNAFGVGFEGAVCNSVVSSSNSSKTNPYKSAAKKKVLFYKPFESKVKVDNKDVFVGNVFQISVNIGKSLGKGYKIAPNSKVDDNFFHITLIPQTSILAKIKLLKLIEKGKHLNNPGVRVYKGKNVSIDIINKTVEAHRDGLPFNIEHKVSAKLYPSVLKIIERSDK